MSKPAGLTEREEHQPGVVQQGEPRRGPSAVARSMTAPLHVAIVATPDAQVAPLSGLYEALTAFPLLRRFEPALPRRPFEVEVVASDPEEVGDASGLRLNAHHRYDDVARTDVAIVPLMMVRGRRLERTRESVERIGLEVGYENTAFFRRVFKRATRLTPGAYRRKFGSRFRLP